MLTKGEEMQIWQQLVKNRFRFYRKRVRTCRLWWWYICVLHLWRVLEKVIRNVGIIAFVFARNKRSNIVLGTSFRVWYRNVKSYYWNITEHRRINNLLHNMESETVKWDYFTIKFSTVQLHLYIKHQNNLVHLQLQQTPF